MFAITRVYERRLRSVVGRNLQLPSPSKQLGPLVGVKVARRNSPLAESPQGAAVDNAAEAVAEAIRDEAVVASDRPKRNQRLVAPSVDEDARVDRGSWLEREAREPARKSYLERRSPHHSVDAARPRHGTLESDSPLD